MSQIIAILGLLIEITTWGDLTSLHNLTDKINLTWGVFDV